MGKGICGRALVGPGSRRIWLWSAMLVNCRFPPTGRVIAQAASDTGTKVDKELVYLRVLDDLDEPHIRLLRLMTTKPPRQDAVNRQMEAIGRTPIRQWHPSDLGQADPGLAEVVRSLLPVLDRHGLISGGYEVLTQAGREPEYTVTRYGEWVLTSGFRLG